MEPSLFSYLRSVGTIAAAVLLLVILQEHVTKASAASVLLLSIVVAGRIGGLGPALCAAVMAATAFSYFFLPPVGFSIRDPNDWISLLTFMVTAVIAGGMSGRTRRLIHQRDHYERMYWSLYGATANRDVPDPRTSSSELVDK